MKSRYENSFRRQIKQALSQQPEEAGPAMADALFSKAVGNHQAGQFPQAEALYRQILQADPGHAGALHLLGVIMAQTGQYAPALELIDKAIQIYPQCAEAYHNRGNVLYALARNHAALESYDRAIQLKPDYAEAYNNRGSALLALHQIQAALESYDKAILFEPQYAEAYFGRGTALFAMERYPSALESLDKAILLKPEFAEAHNNRGSVLLALTQYEAALQSYDKAILFKPDCVDTHDMRGNVLQIIGQYQAALESYDKAFLIRPEHKYVRGMRLHMRRLLCEWKDAESECRQLEIFVDREMKVTPPFMSLAFSGSPAIQRKAAEIYTGDMAPARAAGTPIPRRPRRGRIRIGYFSADYYKHATSYLMAELFERHDRSRFEIFGFSFGPSALDEMGRRVASAMDQFLDVRSMTNREVAELSRRLEVDIAVDLKGYTRENRAGIFAERAAPIQVNYLGYPGTMAAEYIDYLIADPTVIPKASRKHYSEKIVYLPDSYQPNDSRRAISTKPCARAAEGLPETGFVFCCFNNPYKITPSVFDVWMRILGRVEGSVLWLLENNPLAGENLRKEAWRRNISPERLVFARTLPLDEHLARHRLADLFLDTLPYNAHTTASDALWAGLPVLTRMGETFASRVAASLLRAVNLPELITATEAEFEELAVELAHDTEGRHALRRRLQRNRLNAPLFNSRTFTRHLEAAYSAMIERYEEGLPPEHIHIPQTSVPNLASAI